MTLTQDGTLAWDDLLDQAKEIIETLLPEHNPEFESLLN